MARSAALRAMGALAVALALINCFSPAYADQHTRHLLHSAAGAGGRALNTYGDSDQRVGPAGGYTTISNYERVCPAGAFVTGVTIRSGQWVDALGPIDCGRNGGASQLQAFGGGGGNTVQRDASPDGYTAVRVESGAFIDGIALTRADGTVSQLYGQPTGSKRDTLSCPYGTRIAGFFGRQTSMYPVTLGVVCRDRD